MPKTNYRLLMEKEVEAIRQENRSPRLLLHVCCAPCSSGCLEELCETFRVTCFYFNPNISPKEEHDRRAAELERLIDETDAEKARANCEALDAFFGTTETGHAAEAVCRYIMDRMG